MAEDPLKALIRESLAALSPGSEFIIAHKNHPLFPKEHPEWMYDWVFIPRTEEDTLKLVKEIDFTGNVSIFYADDAKIVYFLRFRV